MDIEDLVPRIVDTVIVQQLQSVTLISKLFARREYKLGRFGWYSERFVFLAKEYDIDCLRRECKSRRFQMMNLLRNDSLEMPPVVSEDVVKSDEIFFLTCWQMGGVHACCGA